ncbi:hypothetical protein EVAR_97163_1 [Eumeta japonica]|uniref:Uncharacterized protein n=1 Tax=Eumeta variegata TaxID=151549 RepID=A0A4C1XQS0_EUMVA|nr:hypothetical protein EVAR_97163_1 [Eumeta japonica]
MALRPRRSFASRASRVGRRCRCLSAQRTKLCRSELPVNDASARSTLPDPSSFQPAYLFTPLRRFPD